MTSNNPTSILLSVSSILSLLYHSIVSAYYKAILTTLDGDIIRKKAKPNTCQSYLHVLGFAFAVTIPKATIPSFDSFGKRKSIRLHYLFFKRDVSDFSFFK